MSPGRQDFGGILDVGTAVPQEQLKIEMVETIKSVNMFNVQLVVELFLDLGIDNVRVDEWRLVL